MDTKTATPQQNQPGRDHGAARRSYLDTYARQRAGISETDTVKEVAVVATQKIAQQPVSIPEPQVQVTQQPIPTTPVVEESIVIESQPPVVGDVFGYTPQTRQPIVESSRPSEKKTYLDTLTQRHTTAVATAPQAEDTVMQSALSQETESLLDEIDIFGEPDSESEANIEANLGALYGDYSLTSQLAKSTSSASASHVRTIVASSLACGILALGITGLLGRYSSQPVVAQPTDSPVIEVDASSIKAPAGTGANNALSEFPQTDPTHPVRMLISSIGVNAPVQSLGTTTGGLIDVPQSYGVVGWYNKGSVPGKPGPAVMVGHYTGGNGGVFDKLKDLKDGDLITVTNGKGQTFTYKVSAKNEYAKDAVPMAELFKSSSESKLQIITCSGKWQSKNYNNRLVITADIVK